MTSNPEAVFMENTLSSLLTDENSTLFSSMERRVLKEYLAGNLCRCSGYEGQLRGIQAFLAWKRSKEAAE